MEAINDESFLSFLGHQVKEVFDNDCYCNPNHHSIYNLNKSKLCTICIQEFINHSKYKEYFSKLYIWFNETITH